MSWSLSPESALLTLCVEGRVCVLRAGLGAGSTSQLSGFSVFSRVVLRVVPGLSQAGDLASRSKSRFALPESACGDSGVREEQPPPWCGVGAALILACVLGPSVLDPQGPVQPPIAGPFFRVPGGVGPVLSFAHGWFSDVPRTVSADPQLSGAQLLQLPPLLFSLLLWFLRLRKNHFVLVLVWLQDRVKLDHVFSLLFYPGSQKSLDNTPNP